jgi:phosphatidylglycerol---prolipoprotein diacylglyceryl transferase
MINKLIYPSNWGVKPVLFSLGQIDIPAYTFFSGLGILIGLALYYYETRKKKVTSENGIYILMGSLVGGIIGAKLLEILINYKFVMQNLSKLNILFSGRTIVGGLIGGTIGVNLTKKFLGIKGKTGNYFAPGVALGVAIGRIGCFFRGCCYGQPTSLPWGINFGDGILRHPTQIYESIFMLGMFFYLEKIKDNENIVPGQLFKIIMVCYFIFRFFIEFLRVEPVAFAGITYFQVISIAVIVYMLRDDIKTLLKEIAHAKA